MRLPVEFRVLETGQRLTNVRVRDVDKHVVSPRLKQRVVVTIVQSRPLLRSGWQRNGRIGRKLHERQRDQDQDKTQGVASSQLAARGGTLVLVVAHHAHVRGRRGGPPPLLLGRHISPRGGQGAGVLASPDGRGEIGGTSREHHTLDLAWIKLG